MRQLFQLGVELVDLSGEITVVIQIGVDLVDAGVNAVLDQRGLERVDLLLEGSGGSFLRNDLRGHQADHVDGFLGLGGDGEAVKAVAAKTFDRVGQIHRTGCGWGVHIVGLVNLPVGRGIEERDAVGFGLGRVNALFSPLGVERETLGDGIGAEVPCFGESAVILVPTGEVAVFFGRVGGPVDRAARDDADDGSHIGAAVAVKGDGEGRGGFRGGGVIGGYNAVVLNSEGRAFNRTPKMSAAAFFIPFYERVVIVLRIKARFVGFRVDDDTVAVGWQIIRSIGICFGKLAVYRGLDRQVGRARGDGLSFRVIVCADGGSDVSCLERGALAAGVGKGAVSVFYAPSLKGIIVHAGIEF